MRKGRTKKTHLGLAPGDGIPEIARKAHLVAGVDVSVTEHPRRRIEKSVVEGQGYAASVTDRVDEIRRRGDDLGVVILHGLLEQGKGFGSIPLPLEERQRAAIASEEEGRGGGITRRRVVVKRGRFGGGGLRERR